MAFLRAPLRAPTPARIRAAVFAVGRRVYVAGGHDRSARVTLTDGADGPLANLKDGAEVTIVAWLPNAAGTRYRVRVTDSGVEGWLPVGNLRGTKAAISPSPAVSPPPVVRSSLPAGASGRRVGQRV